MKERTFETGGETLEAGSTVVVFDGNTQRERVITSIGTRRVYIASTGRGRAPVPYDKETRASLQGDRVSYFRTHAEVTEHKARVALKAKLRELGFEVKMIGADDKLDRYPTDVLAEVVRILEEASKSQGS